VFHKKKTVDSEKEKTIVCPLFRGPVLGIIGARESNKSTVYI
jgi:hypothetical protein